MNFSKIEIQKILNNEKLPPEAKNLLEALILDKNAQIKTKGSESMPNLYQFNAIKQSKDSKDRFIESKQLEEIVLETQQHLRDNYTRAFAAIADSADDREVIEKLISDYVRDKNITLSGLSAAEVIQILQDEILDFGQLNELIYNSPHVEEIRINGSNDPVKVMIEGKQYDTDIVLSAQNCYLIAERMVRTSKNAKPLRKDQPFTRVRLGNNIRVTVITDPIAREEGNNDRVIQLIIRKQASKPFSKEFLTKNSINDYGYALIESILKYKISTVFYGGTNSGKTGTLRAFLNTALPNNRRGITVAEIDEMNLRKIDPFTKMAQNEVLMWELSESLMNFRQAVNSALTCSPETLILQEMKGEECVEVMDGSITGHQTVVTMHAEDQQVFGERILSMYKQSGSDVSDTIILSMIPNAFPIIISMQMLADGTRRITSIDEVVRYDKTINQLEYRNLLQFVIDDTMYKLEEGIEIEVEKVEGHYQVDRFISDRLKEKMLRGGMSQREFQKLKTLYEKIAIHQPVHQQL